MNNNRPSNDELAKEAHRWDNREMTPAGWEDSPEAIPRIVESAAVGFQLPREMLLILKEFARRENIGHELLIKRWLDERIRLERDNSREERARIQRAQHPIIKLESPTFISKAAAFDARQVNDLPESGIQ